MTPTKIVVNLKYDGNGNLLKSHPEERSVATVYENGMVKDHVGDVWQVIEREGIYWTVK